MTDPTRTGGRFSRVRRAAVFRRAAVLRSAGLAGALAGGTLAGAALAGCALAGCAPGPYQRADAMRAEPLESLGEDRISLHWKFATADRRTEVEPQEFAQAAVAGDTVYVGSASGMFYALRASTGVLRWRKRVGAMATAPVPAGGLLYLGTADGALVVLDAQTGVERWRYQGRGPIQQPPIVTSDLVVFSNEADQVVALDGITGKLKWQYKGETPEEYTLRGHAGVVLDGELVFTGFANGILVALRKDTGSVAWSTSLRAEADRFMDVDATPIVLKDRVYASSSSGGVYGLDKTTGLIRWRMPFWDAAQPGATGNVGARGGGEPAQPVIWNDLLFYSLTNAGMFIADRKTGQTLEYFDPGDGVSARPTVTSGGQLLVMSNLGVLYAFDLE